MSDPAEKKAAEGGAGGALPPYEAPKGATTSLRVSAGGRELALTAHADWLVLRKEEEPVAEIFHVAYLLDGAPAERRPITFVFNGGPGASSAYLHLGALGPRRVAFDPSGAVLPPPARLVDNEESWLAFTDLVFVDPVGTGFSRMVDRKRGKPGEDEKGNSKGKNEFYHLNRDLDSLGEFIQRFLSRHHRWLSPVLIAGESYGGFRVGKLSRRLQEGFGVGLSGAILISPALEWTQLVPTDYEVQHFVDVFPTMVAAAHFHRRCRALAADLPLPEVLRAAEEFATGELTRLLVQGERADRDGRAAALERAAALLGLPVDLLRATGGRIRIERFARELLRDRCEIVGLYDATATAFDPYPGRETGQGPDPTLFSIERVFTAGINALLRATLQVSTERDYRLLSLEVNKAWALDTEQHVFERHVGATDDLRYAMSLNPHMKVLISHGLYDLVTPYHASDRLVGHMQLPAPLRANLTTRHFPGGHMFYTWDRSRAEFRDTAAAFVSSATGT